jgi:pilus assembly protein CpaB
LPLGTIITADAIGYQPWPKDLVQDAYFVEGEADMAKMLGTVVRQPITAGEPVTRGSLVSPGDRGFLAAALGPGMRAVTIAVSDHTAVAGFVFPGDHIDLVLTQSVKGAENQAALQTSETILKNLRVLATDQSTEQETVDGKTRVHTFGTVTVEVTPKIAERSPSPRRWARSASRSARSPTIRPIWNRRWHRARSRSRRAPPRPTRKS